MLNILIVEDDSQLAQTLKYLVEDNPRYRVVAMAEDAEGAIAAAEEHDPDLVLLDLHLANASTGFSVAVRLNDMGVPCLFVSGKAPSFPMPDLALGCLMKPFTAEDVHRSLAMAEDLLRGRETLAPAPARQSDLYESDDRRAGAEPGFIESQAVAAHPARALDLGPPAISRALKPHLAPARLAQAKRRLGQRRAGVEQRLAPALDRRRCAGSSSNGSRVAIAGWARLRSIQPAAAASARHRARSRHNRRCGRSWRW